MAYDIFISYRRDGGVEIARHLYDLLTRDGYEVSFDLNNLHNGDFDATLLKRVRECKDFILICDAHVFDKTLDPKIRLEDDWVRIELSEALKLGKNVIPIMLKGFNRFPSNLPKDIEGVVSKNGPKYNQEYFDAFYERLKQFLVNSDEVNISRISQQQKTTKIDKPFKKLYSKYHELDFYSVINQELINNYWKDNWNHHFLLMMVFCKVGDRKNYSNLLQAYQSSGIVYYPEFYNILSQMWDMLKMGYVRESFVHLPNLSKLVNPEEKLGADIVYNHILLLSGNHQEAINNYREILNMLNPYERFQYVLKDFDTIRWLGFNNLNNLNIIKIGNILGYGGRNLFTSLEGSSLCQLCQYYENLLISKRWHCIEDGMHIFISFKKFNTFGNVIYYFEGNGMNMPKRNHNGLPFALNKSNMIRNSGRAFCQYRICLVNKHPIIEEYNPMTEQIFTGEIIYIDENKLHIKIIENGNPNNVGTIRKYEALVE